MRNFTKLMAATSFILGLTCVAHAWDDFAPPSDAEIGQVILTANQAEIDAGKLASQKAQNQALKDFGQMLAKDHTAANVAANVLFIKIGMRPADNDISRGFSKSTTDQLNQLKNLSGNDFDKAFIAQQIGVHQQLLQSIDQQLIPAVQNNDLKSFIQSYRGKVEEHLKKLQELQGQIH